MKTIALNFQKQFTLRLGLTIYFLSYSIPFIFSHPQLITGTIINALLFIASEKLNKKFLFPLLILPSLGAVTHGVLFGSQTMSLIYFLPFIWLGNFVQTSIFALTKEGMYFVRIIIASTAKYFVLFFAATIYYRYHIVPQPFIISMGVVQLFTACLGGFLSFLVIRFFKKYD